MWKRWRKRQESESKTRRERDSYLSKKTVTCLIDTFVGSCTRRKPRSKVPRVGNGRYLPICTYYFPCHPSMTLGKHPVVVVGAGEGARAPGKVGGRVRVP